MPRPTRSVRRVIPGDEKRREDGAGEDEAQGQKAENAVGNDGILDDDERPAPDGGYSNEQQGVDQSQTSSIVEKMIVYAIRVKRSVRHPGG